MKISLGQIARARSGDKGSAANIGVVARSAGAYDLLCRTLTAAAVEERFGDLGARGVVRYELPNLQALNFVLPGVLGPGGGSLSLRSDAQGKALGQSLLQMTIDVPDDLEVQR